MGGFNDIGVFEKRLDESRLYNMSFSPKMAETELIVSVISVVSTPTTMDATPLSVGGPLIDPDAGKIVQFRLSGGSEGGKYLQVAEVRTNFGNVLQCEGYLTVRAIDV